ncbi:MAG: RagB/SusD family nutrient uptake outer membrane protein [Flavobacteriales bacterium]|nr:RagB/SusD family nutrient uptake outer membrane protein [Flavobacteriales bacterium]
MKKIFNLLFVVALGVISTNCSKSFLDPDLQQSADKEGAIKNVDDLGSVINATYNRFRASAVLGRDGIVYGDVQSDNIVSTGATGRFIRVGQFDMLENSRYASDYWYNTYRVIATCNLAIDSNLESDGQVDFYRGQAYALRAFAHFNLLLKFGQQYVDGGSLGIAYIDKSVGPDHKPARETIAENYAKIIADYKMAISLMDAEYNPSNKSFLNLDAVNGLLGRAYLYNKNYSEAISASEAAIESGAYALLSTEDYFNFWVQAKTDSKEVMFQLGFNGNEQLNTTSLGYIFQDEGYGDLQVTSDLVEIYDADDVRGAFIVGGFNYGKFADLQGNNPIPIIRYSEVLLNIAEAKLNLNSEDTDAKDIIDLISTARGGSDYLALSLDNILLERRKELAFEGFRFYDLARNGRDINAVDGSAYVTQPYGSYTFAFPIPQSERDANTNMVQNKGY